MWFNAWTVPPGTVLEGLVRSVLDEVDDKLVRRAARKKHLLTGLGVGASVAAGLLGLGNVADRLWAKTSEDPKRRNQLNGFVREAMDLWLQKGAHRNTDRLIVVFVDDLDRCSPTTVMQVFEAVKLGADVTADPSQLEGLVRRYLPSESPRGTEKVVRQRRRHLRPAAGAAPGR